jgi:hypothetical protein
MWLRCTRATTRETPRPECSAPGPIELLVAWHGAADQAIVACELPAVSAESEASRAVCVSSM